ncbi:MAG: hypothetical protein ACI8X5_001246 [Planctomycetota bacterium]|jgi:hypothetical protein
MQDPGPACVKLPRMNPIIYSIIHVVCIILLTAFTFQAFAEPDLKNRSRILRLTGIFGLLAAIAGFGLQAKLIEGFPLWLIVKIVCWLGITGMAGIAFRKPDKTKALSMITMALIIVAVLAVYLRPFA